MSLKVKDKKISEKIVNEIMKDLCDRSGLQNEWENIDSDVQGEIKKEWRKIVIEILNDK
ncbi:MAG: hypothetical protein HYW78_03670 [Parcubacteria group bacterium]|nr:hypothetical protein [Parcubacteria group bacterium]